MWVENHIKGLKKQTDPAWSSQKLKIALWTLARVQVATWCFWHFDHIICLHLPSTSCLWFYFVDWMHKTQESSHFPISESESCKTWILDWLKITIHKIKAHLRPRQQSQQICQVKSSKSACGHLHTCKWPLHPNWHFLTWRCSSACGHVICAFRTNCHSINHQIHQVLDQILDKILLNLHFLTIQESIFSKKCILETYKARRTLLITSFCKKAKWPLTRVQVATSWKTHFLCMNFLHVICT